MFDRSNRCTNSIIRHHHFEVADVPPNLNFPEEGNHDKPLLPTCELPTKKLLSIKMLLTSE